MMPLKDGRNRNHEQAVAFLAAIAIAGKTGEPTWT
jgi:hypothetical protein